MSEKLIYHKTVKINAPISDVWNALTNPEMTKQFMYNCIPITDWSIGSPLIWRGADDNVDYVTGHVLAFDKPNKLSFSTFDPNGKFKDVPDNYLIGTYVLSHHDGLTTIEISQSDFSKVEDGQRRFEEAEAGWSMAMDALKKVLET